MENIRSNPVRELAECMTTAVKRHTCLSTGMPSTSNIASSTAGPPPQPSTRNNTSQKLARYASKISGLRVNPFPACRRVAKQSPASTTSQQLLPHKKPLSQKLKSVCKSILVDGLASCGPLMMPIDTNGLAAAPHTKNTTHDNMNIGGNARNHRGQEEDPERPKPAAQRNARLEQESHHLDERGLDQNGHLDEHFSPGKPERDNMPQLKETLTQEENQNLNKENDNGDGDTSSEEDDDELEAFRPVMAALNLELLRKVALRLRCRQLGLKSSSKSRLSCEIIGQPLYGSFNLVYVISFSDDLKWIARVPGYGISMTSDLCQKMNSEYHTMRLIRANTSIPLPEVYTWDTSSTAVGSAYALLSFVEGTALDQVWRGKDRSTEALRLKALSSLARCMSELHKLRFSKVGALQFDNNGALTGVGSRIALTSNIESGIPWEGSVKEGPYNTITESILADLPQNQMRQDSRPGPVVWIMTMAIRTAPRFVAGNGSFALEMHDFNYQNIFVNDEGDITGIIDWDEVQTSSNSAGFARYPSWITRDWDPAMYGIPEAGADWDSTREDSPEQLSAYRKHYADEFAKLNIPGYHPIETKISHILEALSIAAGNSFARPCVVERLLHHAFQLQPPFSLAQYCRAYEKHEAAEMDLSIQTAFRNMWHAEWEQEAWPEQKEEICSSWIKYLVIDD